MRSSRYIDIFLQRSPLLPELPYEWVWELKYLKKGDAVATQIQATLEGARMQLERYWQLALFAGRSDVKFAARLFIGKDQYHVVRL